MMVVTIAVEGASDEAVVRRICGSLGLEVGPAFVANGKVRLDARLSGYNHAARFGPWLVLRDLDHDADCAPTLVTRLLPKPAEQMLLRVPVRTVESWLLADRENFANYFGVSLAVVPSTPEDLERPKRTVVDLARRSTKRGIREGVVPAPGISAEVGPGYSTAIIEFATRVWNPERAAEASPSLMRCLRSLSHLKGTG
jgi:hypothetical protein